jgi:tRNA pseudouridine55 synthase
MSQLSHIEGVLPVHKPVGYTSHDVVAKARRMLGIKRIGHTGTLDPAVSGVLPLCIGRATRIVEWIQDLPKTYEAVMRIGVSTTTEDSTGEVVDRVDEVNLTEEGIRSGCARFIGDIEQIPPMYSAVKHEGRRLYDLARQGLEVERKPRKASIYSIDIHGITWEEGHAFVRFAVTCSKGTYVRTLCVDIGRALGYPALMHSLIRTASGNITLDQCLTLEQIEELVAQRTLENRLIAVDTAVSHFPSAFLTPDWTSRAQNGLKLPSESGLWPTTESPVRVYSSDCNFIGMYRYDDSLSRWVPIKLFH